MTFKTLNIINIILVLSLSPLGHWRHTSLWYLVIIELVYISILFFACTNLSWNFFITTKCSATTNEKIIALSFDDGPAAYTTRILDTLQQHNTPAIFFCIGKNIRSNEQTLLRIKEEGHIIGNHSYSHDYGFDLFSSKKMLADIQQMNKEIGVITGLCTTLFRPPYGVMNPNLARAIKKAAYIPIGWSIRSFDTRIKDKQMLLSRIMKQVKPGGIILLHDSMEITAAILPELIQQLTTQGYKIVRLDKMLNIDAYA